jgi:hypothetical protein
MKSGLEIVVLLTCTVSSMILTLMYACLSCFFLNKKLWPYFVLLNTESNAICKIGGEILIWLFTEIVKLYCVIFPDLYV